MHQALPFVLTIAGLDPSGGAGLNADIKVFANYALNDFAVATAITAQNENNFFSCEWIAESTILAQLQALMISYTIKYVKIGIIENTRILNSVINKLVEHNPEVFIVWDPILRASAGYQFIDPSIGDHQMLKNILPKLALITPNIEEWNILSSNIGEEIFDHTNVFIKSYSKDKNIVEDVLRIRKNNAVDGPENRVITHSFSSEAITMSKHGSGCVLSSAIIAGLAQGWGLLYAIHKARQYTLSFLMSNDTRLGQHHKFTIERP